MTKQSNHRTLTNMETLNNFSFSYNTECMSVPRYCFMSAVAFVVRAADDNE